MTDVRAMSDAELLRLYGGDTMGAPRQPVTGGLGTPKTNLRDLSDDELLDYYEQFGDPIEPFEDVARSAPGAAYHGVTGLATLPGLADTALSGAVNFAASGVGAPEQPRLFGPGGGVSRAVGLERGILPTQGELESQLEKDIPALGELPEPQTGLGKISSAAITGAIGGAGLGPGGLVRSSGIGAAAGGLGEAAGQGLEGIGVEGGAADAARLITTLGVGGTAGLMKPRDISPSRQALEREAARRFEVADKAGVAIKQKAIDDFTDHAIDLAQREGHRRDIPTAREALQPTPMTEAILSVLANVSVNKMTLTEAHRIRQTMGNAISKAEGNDRRIVMKIRNDFDNFIEKIPFGGDLQEGIRLWSRLRKSDELEELSELARINANPSKGYTYSEALRQQYKTFAKSDRMKGFSKEEQAAIKKVANGGPLDLVTQMMATFYPFSTAGALRSGAIGGGFAYGGQGGLGAIFPVAGIFGKAASNALVRKQAAMADMLVRGGAGTQLPRGALMSGVPLSLYYGNMATTPPGGQ